MPRLIKSRSVTSRLLSTLLLALAIATPQLVSAEEAQLKWKGLTLNANLSLADESGFDTVILITHGTLAHNKMEIIQTWQELLNDEDISSLAINLSLGIDDRHGMYDCDTTHTHKHTDAIEEIDAWVNWLKSKGTQQIILAGHSRGGNQTAWYIQEQSDSAIKGQILLAPQTWSEQNEQNNYAERYQQELSPLLSFAKTQPKEKMMDDTHFIYCSSTQVTTASFLNYYSPDPRLDTPYLLKNTTIPTLLFSGSEDTTVPDLPNKMANIGNTMVTPIEIEGAGHFFRDLYLDDVIEHSLTFIEGL